MKRIVTCLIAAFIALPLFTTAAKSDNAEQSRVLGNSIRVKQYVGAGVFIPKEGDIDVGPSAVYGIELKSPDNSEKAFIDIAFTESGLADSVLWTRGNARQTVFRIGMKWELGDSDRWRYGLALQSHSMDFGSRSKSAVTVGALLEYRLTKRLVTQFESSQETKKSDIRFGSFHMMILREL